MEIIIPLLSFALQVCIFYWVHIIKVNSDEQVKQNKEIISLLKKIYDDNTSNSGFH
ncbi:hypothetical protein PB1_06232 [Bacillus methanolicus PB1]|uniref:Uncharacterized protein n=1 Tax=Bacillus methanolicus PB1 TaxID=997296 RepID=I3E0B9_BACMT|nr:hypothetical protein PB1_06232 [Bacillus methanolicus PB1]